MKQISKRLTNLILIVSLAFLSVIPALSATPALATNTYSITIQNAKPNPHYGAYLIFTGDLEQNVLTNITWGTSISNPEDLLSQIKTINADFANATNAETVSKVLSTANATTVEAFAKCVGNWLTNNSISPSISTNTFDATSQSYTLSNLSSGYYLVKDETNVETDASTQYILNVVGNTSITPKSDIPTVEKKILEDSTLGAEDRLVVGVDQGNFNDIADWEIGQTGSFKVYAHLPAEIWSYDSYGIEFVNTRDTGFDVNTSDFVVSYITDNAENPLPNTDFSAEQTASTLNFKCDDIKSALTNVGVSDQSVSVAS